MLNLLVYLEFSYLRIYFKFESKCFNRQYINFVEESLCSNPGKYWASVQKIVVLMKQNQQIFLQTISLWCI